MMALSIDDQALDDDGADLPPPGTRHYEVGTWLTRHLGRPPTAWELAALRRRMSLRARRRVLVWRRTGLSDAQIVERLSREFLESPEAAMGAALTAAALAGARASVAVWLGLSDAWANMPDIPARRDEIFLPPPGRGLRDLERYADDKIAGRPLSPASLDRDHVAAINAGSTADLRHWRDRFRALRRGSDQVARAALAGLAAQGLDAMAAHPGLDLDRPEPGPPRELVELVHRDDDDGDQPSPDVTAAAPGAGRKK